MDQRSKTNTTGHPAEKHVRSCVLPSIARKKNTRLGPADGPCDMRCLIRSHPLFRQICNADFKLVLEKAKHWELKSHTSIYSEGEACQRFFLVIEGSVKLFMLAEDGSERVVGNAIPLQAIGEHEIFTTEQTYHHYAETTTPTRLIAFSSASYLSILQKNNLSAFSFLNYLAEKRSSHFFEIETVTTGSAKQRVLSYLKMICKYKSKHPDGFSEVSLPIPKHQIASYLGMKPETFSRVLADLKESNIIINKHREVIIINPLLLDDLK